MSLYKNIFSQSLKIVWRYKFLWFFGLFAALLGGGGEYEIFIRGLSGGANQDFSSAFNRIAETGIFSRNTLTNIGKIMGEDPLSLLLVLAVCLGILSLFGFLVWLSIISQAAIVDNSAKIITKKKPQILGIQDGVITGIKNFWPVFGLNILVKTTIFLVFYLISLPIVLTIGKTNLATANLIYLVAFLIFIPLAIAFSFMVKYAIAYVVIRGSSFIESIKQGWQLFIKNWLVSLEMAFILFFINLLFGLALSLVILTMAVPFILLALIFYKLASIFGLWLIIILATTVLLAIIILSGAVLATFQISSWTGLFIELISKGGTSKILRLINKIVK